MHLRFAVNASAALLISAAPLPAQTAAPDPVIEWSVAASRAAASSGMAPLRGPLTLALVHLAMYDAVNAIAGGHEPYAVRPVVERPASAVAAAVEAGYRVLLVEFPAEQAALQATYERLLASVPESPARTNGVRVGAAVAHEILRMRARDGRNATVSYVPRTGPGVWGPTPPGLLKETTAFLARVTPFTMDSPSGVHSPGPPTFRSKRWADDYNEVKALGAKDSSRRTAAQTATALFWEPIATTAWPPAIRRLAQEQALDLPASARFQAATFAAFADAIIVCWDAKYRFNFWRPITAIRHGDADDNDHTDADPAWEPLGVTPNFPEYAAGHACATAAVAYTIEHFFARRVPIPVRNIVTGEERVYQRADDVVDEVVEARMLLGVHFRSGDEDGADIGRQIARHIRRSLFKPRP